MIGKNATIDNNNPRLLWIQNLVLFFSEAGSIRLDFFHSSDAPFLGECQLQNEHDRAEHGQDQYERNR